ncbi:MAG: hypothetical protein ACOX2N_08055 [Peptococcia bacterium]|jgi:hypothetical protein
MNKWTWIVKHYFTPKAPVETPLQEQWIFSYRSQRDIDENETYKQQEKLKENETTLEQS